MHLGIKERQYYICCQSGSYKENIKPRKSSKRGVYQKESREINATSLLLMYMNKYEDGHVEVEYISAHSSHTLNIKYLPLPTSTKEEVAMSLGVNPNCYLNGKIMHTMLLIVTGFMETVPNRTLEVTR